MGGEGVREWRKVIVKVKGDVCGGEGGATGYIYVQRGRKEYKLLSDNIWIYFMYNPE